MKPYRIGQVVSLILLNLYLWGFGEKNLIYTGFLKGFLSPILHCWSTPTTFFSCPLGALQHFIALHLFPLYPLGFLILIGAFVGRLPCGWVCPFGLLQDLLYKIKSAKWRLPNSINLVGIILGIIVGYFLFRYKPEFGIFFGLPLTILFGLILSPLTKINIRLPAHYLKYLFLLIFALVLVHWTTEPWFCKICPAGTLEAGIPLVLWDPENYLKAMVSTFFFFKIFILGFLLITFLLMKRPFCRAVCPIGALYSLTNQVSLLDLKKDQKLCNNCAVCEKFCPTEIPVSEIPKHPDCLRCLECYYRCPEKAIKISWTFPVRRFSKQDMEIG